MSKAHPFDPELVRELASMLAESDLSEIEVEKGDLRIRVARGAAAQAALAPPAPMPMFQQGPAMSPIPSPGETAGAGHHPDALTSPMVGTAYRGAAPGAKPFVEVGSVVAAGDKVLLIEAMKTFNDIVAPRAGTVRAIYVEDGQPVEYGEPLILVA